MGLASFLQEANSRVLIDAPYLSSASASASALGRGNRTSMEIDECASLPWPPVSTASGGETQDPGLRSQQADCPLTGS